MGYKLFGIKWKMTKYASKKTPQLLANWIKIKI